MNLIFEDISAVPFLSCQDRNTFNHNNVIPEARTVRHNPYAIKVIPDDFSSTTDIAEDCKKETFHDSKFLKVVVQFKCHKGEYWSKMHVVIGEYVLVEGDRGVDVGVVMSLEHVVESNAPATRLLRSATQEQVDFWSTDLKQAEGEALDYCRNQCMGLKLNMVSLQAEYQFDKKKLTIYYAAPDRVEYEGLTKELYRQFGCRIWFVRVDLCDNQTRLG